MNFPLLSLQPLVIAGKLGEATENGFILDQPSVQVFEKKPKEPKPDPVEPAQG